MTEQKIELPREGDRLVDRYTILKRVNLGGFGAVYRAIQDTLGRVIAIKVLLPDMSANNADYVEQFRQEALLTSQLRHPNTITIFDYGQTETGLLFLVMEWLDGKTLTDVLKEEGALSYERCFHISNQILKSLSEAHERGMVHRDLKPSNLVLCTQYGEPDFVKVLDFGLVKNLASEPLMLKGKTLEPPKFTEKRRAPGTPHYMAPEQATGKGTTTSADIYAFGLILYEMLTGVRAMDGTDKMEVLLKQAREPVPPLPEQFQNTFLGKIVARCVEKDPLKRPQTAGVLVREYQHAEDTAGGVELSPADVEATGLWSSLVQAKNLNSEVSSSSKEIFVGRQNEIDEFMSIVKKGIAENRGMCISVLGQTGIGKTCLVHKFADQFLDFTKGAIASGVFLPQDTRAFSAFRHAIRRFLDISGTTIVDGQQQLRRALQKHGITDVYMVNFLSQFVLGKFGQAVEEREEAEVHLEEFFGLIARYRPLLLLIENLHWADTESLSFIGKLSACNAVKQHPFFIVATYRTQALTENRELQMLTERFNRLEHSEYREFNLAWLGRKECNDIIKNAIVMQRPMANQCMSLSKGNPLFLNIVLRFILDEKLSLNASGQSGQKLMIPNTLEKILMRRIKQIIHKYNKDSYMEILRRAALSGETFSPDTVEAILRKEGLYEQVDTLPRVLEIWRREGILRKQMDSESSFEFIHPYIIEFFNSDSSPDLHRLVAKTKEMLNQVDPIFTREEIAKHFKSAKEPKLALRYLEFAANSAEQKSNFAKAKALYEEMLPLLQDDDSVSDLMRVHCELGELSRKLSEFGPARDYFRRTVSLASILGEKPMSVRAHLGLAELALDQEDPDRANKEFKAAKDYLVVDDPLMQSKLTLGMGKLLVLRDDWTGARDCFQKAYTLSSGINNFDIMAKTQLELGKGYLSMGSLREAHTSFIDAQRNFQAVNNTADEADLLLLLATTYYIFLRPDDARDSIEHALTNYQKLGNSLGVAHALTCMAAMSVNLLAFEDAQKSVLRALPMCKKYNDAFGEAEAKFVLSTIELNHGQYENAQTLAEQAIPTFEENSVEFVKNAQILVRLGDLALYQNKGAEAEEFYNKAMMKLDARNSNAFRSSILCHLGLLMESRADFARADALYKQAQEIAQKTEAVEDIYIARINVIKVNLFFSPGRWYYNELLEIANESRTYGMKKAQLFALLIIVWFEGVYGEQKAWENLIAELTALVKVLHLPVAGLLRQFEFTVDMVRYIDPQVAAALRRSAGWIRQYLTT